ncbi:MAG: glycoside hydrolase family 19 protein [Deltaproteobacteria bacterium]|nr:glycoside hydrolase family 19 protein [Deltaproteobacteria bacterium]
MAQAHARQPERIANRVYGGRLGNGDEASGDGFRYRGRGLIQLTGRSNYRAFSRWINDDVIAQPDLVADRYAVYSAVYYWDVNALNEPADLDDVKKVTKKINGGYNGLADRIALLDKAKELLQAEAPPAALDTITHTVTATQLNMRSAPRVAASTWIGTLAQGAGVTKIEDASVAGWSKVRAVLSGRVCEGFVSSQYLQPAASAPEAPAIDFAIPPAHLKDNRPDITRVRDGGRAYPLGEANRPSRPGPHAGDRANQLLAIARYLDSENPAHERYWPKGGTTYCNIYAYDFCCLAGAYLPRVWWTASALLAIGRGEAVTPRYGETVGELNANALHDWFIEHGAAFGWRAAENLDVLQAAANSGEVGIIVAKRKDANRSGHITAVAPEHDAFHAARNAAGEVLRPVETQAGSTNYRFVVKSSAWWRGSQYQSFGFWRHA